MDTIVQIFIYVHKCPKNAHTIICIICLLGPSEFDLADALPGNGDDKDDGEYFFCKFRYVVLFLKNIEIN